MASDTEETKVVQLPIHGFEEMYYISWAIVLAGASMTGDVRNISEALHELRSVPSEIHNILTDRLKKLQDVAYPEAIGEALTPGGPVSALANLIRSVFAATGSTCPDDKHCSCSSKTCCLCGKEKQ